MPRHHPEVYGAIKADLVRIWLAQGETQVGIYPAVKCMVFWTRLAVPLLGVPGPRLEHQLQLRFLLKDGADRQKNAERPALVVVRSVHHFEGAKVVILALFHQKRDRVDAGDL